MTRQMAIDYAPFGIRVNAVCPGTVDTPLLRHSAEESGDPEGFLKGLADAHPIGRIAAAEEIAQFFLFLASDRARFFTGAVLMIDGGFTAKVSVPVSPDRRAGAAPRVDGRTPGRRGCRRPRGPSARGSPTTSAIGSRPADPTTPLRTASTKPDDQHHGDRTQDADHSNPFPGSHGDRVPGPETPARGSLQGKPGANSTRGATGRRPLYRTM